MLIKLWGVRGSLPTPLSPIHLKNKLVQLIERYQKSSQLGEVDANEFIESLPPHITGGYGGHTACATVKDNENMLIIDCGSGLKPLGDQLMLGELGMGRGVCNILLTHFHWDHLIGLPFFTPLFVPGNEIHFWAVQNDLEENIKKIFRKPNFPVNYENLGAKIFYHQLIPRKQILFDKIKVTPYLLDHPDACWGYKFECSGKSFSHCVDSEMTRITDKQLGPDLALFQNVDLATMDAQYTLAESTERVNWGHGSASVGLDLAMREGIKNVLFIHHDPGASDERIYRMESQTKEYYEMMLKDARKLGRQFNEVKWKFATEGTEVLL